MSHAAIERLTASYEALIRALDGADSDSIEKASADLAEAIEQVRSADLAADPRLREPLARLVALGHAAQTRVNFMTDVLRRRMTGIAALRGDAGAETYRANGK